MSVLDIFLERYKNFIYFGQGIPFSFNHRNCYQWEPWLNNKGLYMYNLQYDK